MVEIRRNLAKDGIEIIFPERPDETILVWLKANHYRWSRYAKAWYKKYDEYNWNLATEYFGIASDSEISHDQIAIGTQIEKEHTSDQKEAEKIAMDHLKENPKYYSEPKPKDWAEKELKKESMQKEYKGITSDEFIFLDITYSFKAHFRNNYLQKFGLLEKKEDLKKSLVAKKLMLQSSAITAAGRRLVKEIGKGVQYFVSGYQNLIAEHWGGEVPKEKPGFFRETSIYEPPKGKIRGKSINDLALEEKIRKYSPTRSDTDYINQVLQRTGTSNFYEACLELYNFKAGNHADFPLQGGDTIGEEFILNMMKHYIEYAWDGTVVKEVQKFSFKDPGFEVPAPKLFLTPKSPSQKIKNPKTTEEAVKCLKGLVSKDDRRPAMKYVYRDETGLVASNSYVLVHIPTKLGKEDTLYDPKTGNIFSGAKVYLQGTYPKYKSVIPLDYEHSSGELSLEKLLGIFTAYANTKKIIIPDSDFAFAAFVRIVIGEKIRWYDSYKLFQVADALYCQGTKIVTVNYPEAKLHPMVIKDVNDPERLGLVMPIEMSDDNQTKNSFYIDLSVELTSVPIGDEDKTETELVTDEVNEMFEGAKTAEVDNEPAVPYKEDWFTKENAPDQIKERFGIAKEDYLDKSLLVPKQFIEVLPEGLRLYKVDGKYVRDFLYSDFSQGGNDMAYPEFVPIGEIWYEELMENEKEHIIKHEKDERSLMVEGKSYNEAHEIVKNIEDSERGTNAETMEENKYDFKKGDLVVLKEQYRDKGDTFTYKLMNDPDGMRVEIVPIDSKLNIPPINVVNINEIEKTKNTESVKTPEAKEYTPAEILKDITALRKFVSNGQIEALMRLIRSEEREAGLDILKSLADTTRSMPHTYQTENIATDDKIVHLHYFHGGSDWYIVEKDKNPVQDQAFGYAILNGDYIMAEFGYVSIVELIQNGVELDFYWDKKPFSEVRKKWEPDNKAEKTNGPGAELMKIWDEKESEIMEGLPDGFKLTKDAGGAHRLLAYTREGADVGIIELDPIDIHSYSPAYKEYLDQVVLRLDFFKNKQEIENTGIVIEDVESFNNITEKTILMDEIESLEKNIRNGEKLMENPHFTGDLRPDIEHDKRSVEKKKKLLFDKFGAVYGPKKPESVPLNIETVPEISISIVPSIFQSDYSNEFTLNKAIEALLDKKWNDSVDKWNEVELEFIKGYSGYGGLDKFGEITKGSLFEYFTPEKVIEKMWGLAYKYGYKDGPLLEPSCAIGAFFDRRFVSNLIEKHGYEINKYSAKIAKLLYPEAIINDGQEVKYFEQLFIVKNYTVRSKVTPKYSLVIGNPPYGAVGGIYMGMGEKSYTHANNYIDYFILRGLDLLLPGGLLIYIIGAETAGGGVPFLDQGMNKVKEMILERGKLIDAYRLPSGVFSRTDVTSDIVVFRKR